MEVINPKIRLLAVKNKNFIILAIAAILFINIIPITALSPVLILLFGITAGLVIISIFAPEDFNFLLRIYLLGFLTRVFLSFLFYLLSFIFKGDYSPGFLFSDDGWGYSEQGWQLAQFAERGINITKVEFLNNPNLHLLSGNITEYDYFSGFVYSIAGYSPLSLFFISCFTGSMSALFVYLITKELFSKKAARISSLFAFFWPSFIMWSTQNLKEPMIAMCACILIWSVFYLYRRPSPGLLIVPIASAWVLFKIGFPYAIIVTGMIFFAGLCLFMRYLFKGGSVWLITMVLLLVVSALLLKNGILAWISENSAYNIKNYGSILEFLNYHRNLRAFGSLQFFKNVDVSNVGSAIGFAPIGLLYAIFAPFPWQLGSIMQLLAAPETILFYILMPLTFKGMVFGFRKRFNQSILLLSIVFGMLFFLALVEGNSGTLFRHRFIAFNLLFIFTAVGISLGKRPALLQKRKAS